MDRRVVVCLFAALIAGGLLAAPTRAADYSEFVNGDLSADPALPTPWALGPGVNLLVGSTSVMDHDIVRVSVPANHLLSSIVIQFHEGSSRVFTGLQQGPVWTAGTGFDVDPSRMLGWVDFPINPNQSHVGVDILGPMGEAPGAIGFSPPLTSGVYTMLFQAPGAVVPFALDFNVTPIGGGKPADFNGDGLVNGADLTRWRQSFGAGPGADANRDGVSDGVDFLFWQREFDASAAVAAIPEPAAAMLAALAIAGAVAARRRKAASSPLDPLPTMRPRRKRQEVAAGRKRFAEGTTA
jgi:hypothetical protein